MWCLSYEFMTQAYSTNWMSTVGENINKVEKLACEVNNNVIFHMGMEWECVEMRLEKGNDYGKTFD